jgi:pimeloyl-ACP methyl ester carboxylesterase
MAAMLWATGPLNAPDDPADMLVTLAAEDAFDVCRELHRVAAPTLVVGGSRDHFYTPELFRQTARGIPRSELLLAPRKSHVRVLVNPRVQDRISLFLSA